MLVRKLGKVREIVVCLHMVSYCSCDSHEITIIMLNSYSSFLRFKFLHINLSDTKMLRVIVLHAVAATDNTAAMMSVSSSASRPTGLVHRPAALRYDHATTPAGSLLSPILHQQLQSPEYHLPTQRQTGPAVPAGTSTPVNSCIQPASSMQPYRRPLFSILAARLADKVCQVYIICNHSRPAWHQTVVSCVLVMGGRSVCPSLCYTLVLCQNKQLRLLYQRISERL